jgi:hypothetical protein
MHTAALLFWRTRPVFAQAKLIFERDYIYTTVGSHIGEGSLQTLRSDAVMRQDVLARSASISLCA